MKRSLSLPLVALTLAACNREAPALPATTTATPATPPVVVRADCPADATNLPAFSLAAAAEDSSHLRIETLSAPVRGRCELEQNLFSAEAPVPRSVSTIDTAGGPVTIAHRLRGMAVLPSKHVVLVAADTGLWALDANSMARVARLVPNRIVDLDGTPNGSRIAYVRQDPQIEDDATSRELVVVDVEGLAIVRRFANVPEGRIRLSDDGAMITVAGGDNSVTTYDVARGSTSTFEGDNTVRDAFAVADRPGLVAYVGNDNTVSFRDVRSGASVPQSTAGELPLVTSRDLFSVYVDPTTHHVFAGGGDHQLHEYEDMPGAAPRDARQIRMQGKPLDIACCAEGALAVTTDTVNVAWIKDGGIVREIGPMLPEYETAAARIGVIDGLTVVSTAHHVFGWTRDGLFVQPDFLVGEEVARTTIGGDTLLVLRSRGFLELHRVPSTPALATTTNRISSAEWATIDGIVELADGNRMLYGRAYTHVVAAFVSPNGDVTYARGPVTGTSGEQVAVPQGDGVHFAIWTLNDGIVVVDAAAHTITDTFRIEGTAPTSVTITREGDQWKVVDQTGAARTLAPAPPPRGPGMGGR